MFDRVSDATGPAMGTLHSILVQANSVDDTSIVFLSLSSSSSSAIGIFRVISVLVELIPSSGTRLGLAIPDSSDICSSIGAHRKLVPLTGPAFSSLFFVVLFSVSLFNTGTDIIVTYIDRSYARSSPSAHRQLVATQRLCFPSLPHCILIFPSA